MKLANLDQANKFVKKDTFSNVDDLKIEENQRIDFRLKEYPQQKKKRRRNITVAIAMVSGISLSLASFLSIQPLTVKAAEQLRLDKLTHASWVSPKSLRGYLEIRRSQKKLRLTSVTSIESWRCR